MFDVQQVDVIFEVPGNRGPSKYKPVKACNIGILVFILSCNATETQIRIPHTLYRLL